MHLVHNLSVCLFHRSLRLVSCHKELIKNSYLASYINCLCQRPRIYYRPGTRSWHGCILWTYKAGSCSQRQLLISSVSMHLRNFSQTSKDLFRFAAYRSLLAFPVPKSKCSDGSEDSKLPLHASHVALPT